MSDQPLPTQKPGGVIIYTAYRFGMLAFYLGFVALGLWAVLSDPPQQGGKTMGVGILAVGAISAALFAGSFFLPRKPWAWNVHMVLIVLGIVGVVSTPCAIAVGVFWFRQDTLAWFGQQLEAKTGPDDPAPD